MFKLFFSFKYLNTHGVEFMVVKKDVVSCTNSLSMTLPMK